MYEQYLSKALSNIIMARQAIVGYNEIGQKDLKNGAAYHIQQAIELMLKYCIYNHPGYNKNSNKIRELYVHNLKTLITQYCKPLGIYVPKRIVKNAKTYSDWEAGSRYSLRFSVRIDSILTALNEAENWLIKLKPSYKKKIASVRAKLKV